MTTTHITPAQLGPELQKIFGHHVEAGIQAMRVSAHLARAEVVRKIQSTYKEVKDERGRPVPIPVDTGELQRSGKVDPIERGAIMEFTASHAWIQEAGTRPYMPPLAPLLAWARRKLRGPKPTKKPRKGGAKRAARAKGATPARKMSEAERLEAARAKGPAQLKAETLRQAKAAKAPREVAARQLARAARWHIYLHGQTPKRFHARAAVAFPGIVEDQLRRYMGSIR